MIGTVLRVRYELTQEVADGPIFTTYQARDRVEGREACVRVVKPSLSQDREMARRLFSVVMKYSGIRSSGIESLLEVDEDQGNTFLVSEFTRGITLTERIHKLAPFSVPVSIATMISLCEALSPIHNHGLPHGDLRPHNIMVLVDGQVKVQLPGVWESYSASPHAGALILPLLAPYLAPEVAAGSMPNPSSDVYSAGIILFELLTGRLPYAADTPSSYAIKHATAGIPSVRMFNPSVPTVLEEIVKKAMAKEPAQRYRTATDLLQDLRMVQDALRFGRTLTWPLSQHAIQEVVETAPIAPRMSAVRPEPEVVAPKQKLKKEKRPPGDVPVWMYVMSALLAGFLLAGIAAWVLEFGHRAREVKVPKVVGMKVIEAEAVLRDAGLKMKIIGPPVEGKGPPDTIVVQTQGPGERVREGSVIGVRKSAGPASISVPRIIGMKIDAAKEFLERSDLKLDEVVEKLNQGGAQEGEIILQNPSEYTSVPKGTMVKVTIQSSDAPAGPSPVPGDDSIEARYHLHMRLTGITESVQVRVAIVDVKGTRDVLDQKGSPGDTLDVTTIGYGRSVTFQVFYDGIRVYEQRQSAPESLLPRPSPSTTPSANPDNPEGDPASPSPSGVDPDPALYNPPGGHAPVWPV